MPTEAVSVRAIFDRALEITSDAQRAAYLDVACADTPDLRREVESLLAAHAQVGSFLQSPAAGLEATRFQQGEDHLVGTQIGPYKLLQQIGEGGMGIVYMAQQERPVQRTVALKIIKPGMDSTQVIARFEAERQALALMDHPNIAKVLDAGTTDSARPYFVMELVKGIPIIQYADEHRLTPRQHLELFIPVCQAVQHAHQKGIIHRDLKPTNVLVADYDDRPVPKVIDFGVAKAVGQHLTEKTMFTQLGQVVGTIEYMSPEQAKLNQLDIDTRTDIYSLGVLLYELLTGETPFDRARLHSAAFDEMLRIIREEEPPKPSTRLSTSQSLPSIAAQRQLEPKKLTTLIAGDLDWIVMKSMEKDRGRRYETATGLAEDLQRYLTDQPVEARRPTMTIGNAYTQLGVGDKAVKHLARALELRGQIYGTEHEKYADTLVDYTLAQICQQRPNRPGAESTNRLQTALSIYHKRVIGGHQIMHALQALQIVLMLQARYDDIEPVINQALAEARKTPDVEYPETASIYRGLVVAKMQRGELPEAERLARLALAMQLKSYGPEHPETAWGYQQIGEILLKSRHDLAEALDADRRALIIFRKNFPPGHVSIGVTLKFVCDTNVAGAQTASLAEMFPAIEKLDELHSLFREVVAASPPRPDDRWDAVSCAAWGLESLPEIYRMLSQELAAAGKDSQAEECRKKGATLETSLRSDSHSLPIGSAGLVAAATLLHTQGKTAAAKQLYEDLIERQRQKLGKENGAVGITLHDYAEFLGFTLNDYPAAAQRYLEALPIRRQGSDTDLSWTLRNLGNALIKAGKPAEAETYLREALQVHHRFSPQDDFNYAWIEFLLSVSLRARGELHEADSVLRQSVDTFVELKYSSQNFLNAIGALQEVLKEERREAEAMPLFDEWISAAQKSRSADILATIYAAKIPLLAATNCPQEAKDIGRKLCTLELRDTTALNSAARIFATDPDLAIQDPGLALELAEKAISQAPNDGDSFNTLGVAQYRVGHWQSAINALQESMKLRNSGNPSDWFFLAMANWELGQKAEARKWYDRGVQWMKDNHPKNQEFQRYQDEASKSLMIKD